MRSRLQTPGHTRCAPPVTIGEACGDLCTTSCRRVCARARVCGLEFSKLCAAGASLCCVTRRGRSGNVGGLVSRTCTWARAATRVGGSSCVLRTRTRTVSTGTYQLCRHPQLGTPGHSLAAPHSVGQRGVFWPWAVCSATAKIRTAPTRVGFDAGRASIVTPGSRSMQMPQFGRLPVRLSRTLGTVNLNSRFAPLRGDRINRTEDRCANDVARSRGRGHLPRGEGLVESSGAHEHAAHGRDLEFPVCQNESTSLHSHVVRAHACACPAPATAATVCAVPAAQACCARPDVSHFGGWSCACVHLRAEGAPGDFLHPRAATAAHGGAPAARQVIFGALRLARPTFSTT